jgi:hypothetical protein
LRSPVPASPFDAWADAFAADRVRLSPERAKFSEFLPAAEQCALERETGVALRLAKGAHAGAGAVRPRQPPIPSR